MKDNIQSVELKTDIEDWLDYSKKRFDTLLRFIEMANEISKEKKDPSIIKAENAKRKKEFVQIIEHMRRDLYKK